MVNQRGYGGPYGKLRSLTSQIQMDERHLQNAPLGPRQKSTLAKKIASDRAERLQVRAQIREAKKKKSSSKK